MSGQLEKVLDIYKVLSKYPNVVSGRILKKNSGPGHLSVSATWSQRNLESSKLEKFQLHHFVDISNKVSTSSLPSDCSNVLLASVSRGEEFTAIIRESPSSGSEESKKTQYLDIWHNTHKYKFKSLDLTCREVHGEVYSDGEFGVLEWDQSGEKLIYVAERKRPKSDSYFKPKGQDTKGSKGDETGKSNTRGEEYVFREDWGEQLRGKSDPVLVEVRLAGLGAGREAEATVEVLEGVPPHLCPGQALWHPDGSVIGVAWVAVPRRLGLVFCSNRPSCVFQLSSAGGFVPLSREGVAARSPRASPDGSRVVWLEREPGGPHHAAMRLVCLQWASKEITTVVDIVREFVEIDGEESFFGLYNLTLPKRCWLGNDHVILSTPQKYTVNTYVIEIESGRMRRLDVGDGREGSLQALDAWEDWALCSRSAFTQPPELWLCRVAPAAAPAAAQGEAVPLTAASAAPLSGVACRYLALVNDDEPQDAVRDFTAMYVGPTDAQREDVPLIVFPHGGPHSGNVNSFTFSVALFSALGFGVLLVNYRGSTGAGQRAVEWLPGRVGRSDVGDVRAATAAALRRFPWLCPRRLLLFGGSHGGFLAAHLSARFPDDYRAVVSINPVVDVASMFSVTDIPDWTYVEAGESAAVAVEAAMAGQAVPAALERMRQASPLQHVGRGAPPTLLLLGSKDARVPCSQGLAWAHALRAHDVVTRVLMYDDNHSLSQVAVETDSLINAILWLYKHLEE